MMPLSISSMMSAARRRDSASLDLRASRNLGSDAVPMAFKSIVACSRFLNSRSARRSTRTSMRLISAVVRMRWRMNSRRPGPSVAILASLRSLSSSAKSASEPSLPRPTAVATNIPNTTRRKRIKRPSKQSMETSPLSVFRWRQGDETPILYPAPCCRMSNNLVTSRSPPLRCSFSAS